MKDFLVLLLLLAAFQTPSLVLPAQSFSTPPAAASERKQCCHGCGSYGCNRKNCGEKCNEGPNCRGCWTSCKDKELAAFKLPPTQLLPPAVTIAGQSLQGNPDVKVWVNTNSGVYHCPGTRWYGATKHGEYMTQAEAQKKGYRPAYGKVCR